MDAGIDGNRGSGKKGICAPDYRLDGERQGMSCLLSEEKEALNKYGIGKKKQRGLLVEILFHNGSGLNNSQWKK